MLGDYVRCHLAMTIMHTKTITRNSKYNICTIQVHNMLDGWPLQTLDLHSNRLTFGSFWTDIWLPHLTKGRPYPAANITKPVGRSRANLNSIH